MANRRIGLTVVVAAGCLLLGAVLGAAGLAFSYQRTWSQMTALVGLERLRSDDLHMLVVWLSHLRLGETEEAIAIMEGPIAGYVHGLETACEEGRVDRNDARLVQTMAMVRAYINRYPIESTAPGTPCRAILDSYPEVPGLVKPGCTSSFCRMVRGKKPVAGK